MMTPPPRSFLYSFLFFFSFIFLFAQFFFSAARPAGEAEVGQGEDKGRAGEAIKEEESQGCRSKVASEKAKLQAARENKLKVEQREREAEELRRKLEQAECQKELELLVTPGVFEQLRQKDG